MARNIKTFQTGFLINLLGLAVVIPGLLLIGTVLFSYFHYHPEDMAPVVIISLDEAASSEARKIGAHFEDTRASVNNPGEMLPVSVIEQHYRDTCMPMSSSWG